MMNCSIRGGSGLGDALYVQSVARHLIGQGAAIEVCSDWPEVFRTLDGCVVSPFRRDRIDRLAHYSRRRLHAGTNQFEDCCIEAGVPVDIDLRLDWMPCNDELTGAVHRAAAGRPVVLVQMPRHPMGRSDGYGAELLPDCRAIQRIVDRLCGRVLLVQVGAGEPLFRFSGIDLDFSNRTSVSDLIDLAWGAGAVLGFVSFLVPLAESLNRPGLMVWSRRGLGGNHLIRSIVPGKIIHRPDLLGHIFDDSAQHELDAAADALLAKVGRAAAV